MEVDQGEEGDGSYLVLNGRCLGAACVSGVVFLALPRDRTRWCRFKVQTCSGEGNQAGGERGLGALAQFEGERVRASQASCPGLA